MFGVLEVEVTVIVPLDSDKLIPFPALIFKGAFPIETSLTETVLHVSFQVVEIPLIVIVFSFI